MKKDKNIFLISNMYPSSKNQQFGSFVKSVFDNLEEDEEINVNLIKITYSNFKIQKFFKYLIFYLKIGVSLILNKDAIFYFHFVSHSALPLLFFSKKRKIILNFHGSDLKKSFLLFFVKSVLKKANLVIVPSVYFKNKVNDFYYHPNIFVSPSSGVPDNFFNKRICDLQSKINFGYVGRTIIGKGFDVVVGLYEAVLEDNELASLQVVGGHLSETEYNNINLKFKEYHNINWEFSVERNKLYHYYKDFNILIFPSRFQESLGLVVLEAMANMCIVIMSPQDSYKEILNGSEAVFFTNSNNVKSFLETFNKIKKISNIDMQEKLNNSYLTSSKFRNSFVKKQLISAIKKV